MDCSNSIPNTAMNPGTITGGLQSPFSNLPVANHGVCPTCGTCPTCGSKKAIQSPYSTTTTSLPLDAQWTYTQGSQNR